MPSVNVSLSAGGHVSETIAAISTPQGEGAIALIRLSGPEAVAVVDGVFHGKRRVVEMESHRQHFGAIAADGRKVDEVVVSVHRRPRSYTGEDVVEIACHGGVLVTRRLLELLLRSGARAAEPGEFTQRAFLNGKLDLTQAEAVMDLITAQTDLALAAAQEQLEGRLGQRLRDLRERFLELLAHLEAYIDFPDEDISPDTAEGMIRRLGEIRAELEALLATAGRGRLLREGARTVIFGAPNVGKSSLLNVLLGYERAIVSATPGTTRDSLEETISLRGLPLRLVDTAGVRDSTDEVEQAGIERTYRQLERADLVLHVQDAAAPPASEAAPHPEKELLVLNKADLGEHAEWRGRAAVRISCRDGTGFEALEEAIEERLVGGHGAPRQWSVAINARHQAALRQALEFSNAAHAALASATPPDLVAEDLRAAVDAVGEVIGRVETEDVLGKIFSTFCIGK
jgi:tRNA modification GTPase